LKDFLQYAAQKGRATDLRAAISFPTAFEAAMAKAIEESARKVRAQIGCNGYRIDIAVENPERRGTFSLAVEGDGPAYGKAQSARDRDRLRQDVLQGLGWQMHRVWSDDWTSFCEREKNRLRASLAMAESRTASVSIPLSTSAVVVADAFADMVPEVIAPQEATTYALASQAGESPTLADSFERYSEVTPIAWGSPDQFYSTAGVSKLRTSLLEVISGEGPVHFDVAARRVITGWGIERLTGRPRERIDSIVTRLQREGDIEKRGAFLWPRSLPAESYLRFRVSDAGHSPREIQQIAIEEIANGAAFVLRRDLSMTREDLSRETAKLFGCNRLSRPIAQIVEEAIDFLAKAGRCVNHGDRVSIPPS
jgi:very-short-patch-repair endonuclease